VEGKTMYQCIHDPGVSKIENYVLGNSAQEQARLKLQARFLEKWTGQFLLSAGLERGMRVLDLGCGNGRCFPACGQARWNNRQRNWNRS
jgi:cyclopropane fatty-acyl-phospholipid synthase-like methyltransferase